MPRVVSSEIREIILKVKEYFLKEKQFKGPVIPVQKVNERVAAATGVSVRTVERITSEGKLAQASCTTISELGIRKVRKIRKDKISFDNFDLDLLRQKIDEFHTIKKQVPTVKKLLYVLKEEMGYKGGRELLRRHIKQIGFKFKKPKNNRAWHDGQQKCIKNTEETKEQPMECSDGTQNHSGSEETIGWQYCEQTEACEILESETDSNKPPNSNSKKGEIIEWLKKRNIKFSHDYTRQQLLEIVDRNKPEPIHTDDHLGYILSSL